MITTDAGTNFASSEFRVEARLLGTTCHEVPTEAHHSVGKIERYHAPLRRAYQIISSEVKGLVEKEAVLQMALKAVNDTAGPNGLVPTLLLFGAMPRVHLESPPYPVTLSELIPSNLV